MTLSVSGRDEEEGFVGGSTGATEEVPPSDTLEHLQAGSAKAGAGVPAGAATEAFYQTLFENMPEAFAYCRLVYDEQGQAVDCVHLAANDAYRAFSGIEDPIGKSARELFAGTHESHAEVLAAAARVAATGRPWRGEIFVPEPRIWLDMSISSPEAGHFLSLFRDITERKDTEEIGRRSKFSLDNVSDYTLWVDGEARVIGVSQSTCRQLGYSEEELLGMTLFDICPSLTAERWAEQWSSVRELGSRFIADQHRKKDGTVFPVEISANHFTFADKEYDCAICRDISERLAAEEALRRAQSSMARMSDYPTWLDEQGRIVEVNESTCQHLGYSRDELLNMTVFDIDPKLSPEEWPGHWERAVTLGYRSFESTHRTKDGRDYPVEIVTSAIEVGGRMLECGFCRDISERRQVEEKLQRALFALDNSADYITWLDIDGRIVEVSESTCRKLGYTREELLSMTIFHLNPDLTEEQWRESWMKAGAEGFRYIETFNRKKNGELFPVEISATRVVFGGHEYNCGLCRDLTDRKQAEEKLQRALFALDNIADYPVWLTSEGQIVEVSESTCRNLGYTREELLSMTVFDLNPKLTAENWRKSWATTGEAGFRYLEVSHKKKNGELMPVEVSSTHVKFGGQEYDCGFCRDITERKRMEESLLLTQLTVDRAPEPISWVAPDGRLAYANQAFCDLLGYTREEVTSLNIWDFAASESPALFREQWQEAARTGTIRHEATLRAKDGREYAVEVSSSNVNLGGSEIGVSFIHDFSERKRAEESLRESEQRYRLLFELESYALVLADDTTGQILDVNQATTELYGYTRSELLTMKDSDLFASLDETQSLSGGLEVDPAIIWHRKNNGTVFPVESSWRHLYWKERPVHVVAVRDITRRKKAEDALEESRQMLRTVLDTVPLHVFWRDKDLRYLGCNTIAAQASGLSGPEAIVGLTDLDLPWGAVDERLYRDDLEVLTTGVPKLQYDERIQDRQGNPRVVRTSKVPLRDHTGQIMGLLSMHEDVTELSEAVRTLREREEQLRQSQKMEAIGRLAGGIAHDFNNVLTTIIGYSDLILASLGGSVDTLADDVGEIRAAAQRASSLTKQILAFSRRQGLEPRVLSLNTVIGAAERLLARTIGADVELRVECEPELGLVEVDEHQFVQVLLNLAVNARDAMPDGGVLTLRTENVELTEAFCRTHPDARQGRHVCLSVSDTGTGMDPDTAAHVFEPFYTTKAPGEGTGLGLATVYGVVTQSGGSIYVKTELGQGTMFEIYLPRFDRMLDDPELGDAAPRAGSSRPTILLVDNDETFRGVTVRMLEKRGYRVLPVGDGDHALALVQNPDTAIDLVLTDVVLPGAAQGVHLSQQITRTRPGTPVLYMSAYSRDTIEKAGRLEEGTDYLEKPFTADTLAQRIRESLGADGRNAPR